MKLKAFTLAETLITLGIIGVVSALTIPALIKEHQKRTTVTKLQRAISVINQAYRLSFDEVGEPENQFETGSEVYFKKYWEPYVKVLTYCDTYSTCGYSSNTPFKNVIGTTYTSNFTAPNSRTAFITMDNFMYLIYVRGWSDETSSFSAPSYNILLDVNASKGPNRLGRDLFFLTRGTDGVGVQPRCYNDSDDNVRSGCLNQAAAECCAEYIKRSGWQIPKDYKW